MEIGDIIWIALRQIQPSQPDDGLCPDSDDPIQIFQDQTRLIIRDGNHRYYRRLNSYGLHTKVEAEIVENPYLIR
jgi:hypothetical protein